MAATTIRFIQEPPYEVDFGRYRKNQPVQEAASVLERVKRAVASPFDLVKVVFVSVASAARVTLGSAGTSFKYIVLGYYEHLEHWDPPGDMYLVVFKVMFWIGAMGWSFVMTTARLLYKQTHSEADLRNFLAFFAGNEIDLSHMEIKELEIDVREVPAGVTVNGLLQMFDQINFDRPQDPGYIAPLSRREGNTQYTVEELKTGLQTFIDHVNRRVPFLGTPPAYDVPRLFAFYQQVENAVRFSIHKSDQDLAAFRGRNGNGPYAGAILQEYKNLLEDSARIPLMLAIAGKHCGARYMGEAMELYDAAQGEVTKGTLEDALRGILVAKRKEIARAHIQMHLGSDTHHYTNYMSNLGKMLGIPGSANVIEHLVHGLDRTRFVKLFFKEYTVDCILEAVQTKLKAKKSQVFREKIFDWLKTQPGNWQPAGVLSLDEMMTRANVVLADSLLVPNESLQNLQGLITNLKQPFPSHADWDEFLVELFVSGREWLSSKYSSIETRRRAEDDIRALFSNEQLRQELIIKTKEAIAGNKQLVAEHFSPRLLELQKVSKLCVAITGLNPDTAMRVVKGKKPLQQALEEQRAQFQGDQFLGSLNLEGIAQHGLSKEMLEWLLVSHDILLTQAKE